jgi:hypothetical protein
VSGTKTASAVRAIRGARDDVEQRSPPLVRGPDVEHGDLVGARLVVALRLLDRISRVTQPHEPHAFDDAPSLYVQAWDHTLGEHSWAIGSPWPWDSHGEG